MSKINCPKKLKAIVLIRSTAFVLRRCDFHHERQLKWSMCFCSKDYLYVPLCMYRENKTGNGSTFCSEWRYNVMRRLEVPSRKQNAVFKNAVGVHLQISLSYTPKISKFSAGCSQAWRVCSTQADSGAPTAVTGKGSPGTFWGHCLCLKEGEWSDPSLTCLPLPHYVFEPFMSNMYF